MNGFVSLLMRPSSEFRELAARPRRLARPLTVVGLCVMLVAASQTVLGLELSQKLPSEIKGLFLFTIGSSVILTAILHFGCWFLLTGGLLGLGDAFGGKRGDYRKLLELTGWAQLPLALCAFLTVLLTMAIPSPLKPIATINELATACRSAAESDIAHCLHFVRIVCYLWTAFLCSTAIRAYYHIGRWKAFVCVLAPLFVFMGANTLVTSIAGGAF